MKKEVKYKKKNVLIYKINLTNETLRRKKFKQQKRE